MVVILFFAVLAAWIAILIAQQKIRELMHRVWELEQRNTDFSLSAPVPKEEPAQPVMEVKVEPVPQPPPIPPPSPVPVPPPLPITPQIPQETRSPVEWEALIGGNILNKLGALLLVIGVMTFLGYYGTRMNPAERAGCAVAASLALLGCGVWLERRETYRMFARGLMGAGWAALYATAYAIYALPAARIIDNPFAGSIVVLLVAAGMIGHSLRYRSQGVTAVAFFSAFAALGVTPSTVFAVVALIPLAGAVLFLAQRFNWYHMALMGVFATYGACAWHGSSNAPLMASETLFIAYWALFEVFDLLRFSRKVSGRAVELIFPLNAAGFMGLSYLSWTAKSSEMIWALSGCAALLYLVSAMWRVKIEADRGFEEGRDLGTRIRSGCYEAPLALGAFLVASAIVQKLTGTWVSTALAMEAEALFMGGVRFRSRWLRGLAVLGFGGSLLNTTLLASSSQPWVSLAVFHAILFYANRLVCGRGSRLGCGFSWMASLLVMLAARQELSVSHVGTAWIIFAAILFELGVRKQLREFRWQGYAMGVAGAIHTLVYYQSASHPWVPLAAAMALAYAWAWRAAMLEKANSAEIEWRFTEWWACGATALFGCVLIYAEVSSQYLGAALWGFAVVLLEMGLERLPEKLRPFSYIVALIATFEVIIVNGGANGEKFVKFAEAPVLWANLAAAAGAWIMSGRLTGSSEQVSEVERGGVRGSLGGIGLFFAFCACWLAVPDAFVPGVWTAMGLAVLVAGKVFDVQAYRWLAQVGAGIAAISAFFFTLPDGHPYRIAAMVLLIATLLGFRTLYHTAAASVLAAALIYQEVSGSLLTIAWGAEALALLGVGFAMRDRSLRLQGLGLFLICVLKLFLYDLRNLDTPYRILSFIALGLILLGVSWIYTRFREQLQKLL